VLAMKSVLSFSWLLTGFRFVCTNFQSGSDRWRRKRKLRQNKEIGYAEAAPKDLVPGAKPTASRPC